MRKLGILIVIFQNCVKETGKSHQIKIKLKPRRLSRAGPIEEVNDIKEDVFKQPTMITVKKDRSVMIALDARPLNKTIDKNINQLPYR